MGSHQSLAHSAEAGPSLSSTFLKGNGGALVMGERGGERRTGKRGGCGQDILYEKKIRKKVEVKEEEKKEEEEEKEREKEKEEEGEEEEKKKRRRKRRRRRRGGGEEEEDDDDDDDDEKEEEDCELEEPIPICY
ncbi:hypothetical protein STEG23_012257 [Scotinomys teguina]